MKIEDTNITSLNDYKKTKKQSKIKSETQKPLKPARITNFEDISSERAKIIGKDEAKSVLSPNDKTSVSVQNVQPLPYNSKVVDFAVLSSLYPNIKKSEETELIEFCLSEGYSLNYEQAARAIAKYKQDAVELKPAFARVEQIKKELEERIKDFDVSNLNKITSMYEKKDKREMLANFETPDSFIPSKKSCKVTKNIAKVYVKELQKVLPDYELEVEDDGSNDTTNNVVQVAIKKDDFYLMFFFNDFLKMLNSKKVGEKFQCYIEPQEGNYSWHYDGDERIMSKINKLFSGVVGAVSKDTYNEKGEPEFYIDITSESGPMYYAILETSSLPGAIEKKMKKNDTAGLSEEEIKYVRQLVKQDEEANKYYTLYGTKFVHSCLRDGDFYPLIAEAQSSLIQLGNYFSKNGEISLDYVTEIIKHIEDKNNKYGIDRNLFEIANDFVIKELNSGEEHHNTVYSALDYMKNHNKFKVFEFMESLADDDLFDFKEVDEIFKMLNESSDKKQGVIVQKLNKIVRSFDESGEMTAEPRIYDRLMHELHLD